MNAQTDTDLTQYNGLKVSAKARHLERISSPEKLSEISKNLTRNESIHILGDGTNTVWGAPIIDKTVLKIEIPGFKILNEDKKNVWVKIGAGENWDICVARAVELGFFGIEALSGIPGTAGAGPNQNIGAYGQELSTSLETLTVFDLEEKRAKIFDKNMCHFGYRDSIFKHEAKNKLVILDITLCLHKTSSGVPNYPDTITYFKDKNIPHPSIEEVRQAVLKIRARKLPDLKIIPNCGSFFKNPIINKSQGLEIQANFPTLPLYPVSDENLIKAPAAWFIESLGMKGKSFGNIEIYKNHALALTNPKSNATIEDVLETRDYIIEQVRNAFDITLEMEPELVV
jgi:UDP-N-acetylmuramate dehydrogenase